MTNQKQVRILEVHLNLLRNSEDTYQTGKVSPGKQSLQTLRLKAASLWKKEVMQLLIDF